MSEGERRLWRIDLNQVRVQDADGRSLEVVAAAGVLDGELTVTVTPPIDVVPFRDRDATHRRGSVHVRGEGDAMSADQHEGGPRHAA